MNHSLQNKYNALLSKITANFFEDTHVLRSLLLYNLDFRKKNTYNLLLKAHLLSFLQCK